MMLVPILMLLTVLSTSCSNKPEVIYKDRIVKQYPPQAYLVTCKKPVLQGKTWKYIGQLAIDRGVALEDCTYKIDKIIEWSNGKGPE